MRLRRKLTIAFFGVSSVLSVLLALFLYRFVERQLKTDLRDRLRDIGHIGAHMIDQAAYTRLVFSFGDLDDAKVGDVEHSPDYAFITAQLRAVRRSEPDLIQYAYLLAPTEDANHPRFVVDADVLDLRAKMAAGGKAATISHFNQPYDVSEIPLLKKALAECSRQLETDFVYDPEFKVNSVSAYMPLTNLAGESMRDDKGRCLGVLGVDITDKTIGDAYMVVAGIPQPVADHAIAIAHMATDMIEGLEAYAKRMSYALGIRIGIHSGSVVAGVIGTKKFIYDLWGDTVNTASRMESTGVPGRVQVSAATHALLEQHFAFEERGEIEVKGKGKMRTYLLGAQLVDPNRVSIKAITGEDAS